MEARLWPQVVASSVLYLFNSKVGAVFPTHTHNKNIHPWKLTGIPKIMGLENWPLSNMAILGIYGKFRGGNINMQIWDDTQQNANSKKSLELVKLKSCTALYSCANAHSFAAAASLSAYLGTNKRHESTGKLVLWIRFFAIRVRVALSNNFSHKDPRNPNHQVTERNTDKIGAPRDPPGRIACSKMVFCSCETMNSHNQSEAFMTKIHITSSTVSKIQVMLSGFTPWFNDWTIYLLQIFGCFPICYDPPKKLRSASSGTSLASISAWDVSPWSTNKGKWVIQPSMTENPL